MSVAVGAKITSRCYHLFFVFIVASSTSIIADLATVSVLAGSAAVVFHCLRLPLMLGYLLCGLLVGPHLYSIFPIYNEAAIRDLSHLGVIFLMFYIGLEFDIAKLQKILPSALLAVTLQCIAMIAIGIQVAPMLGWTEMNGLFLGGVLAISSTMITMPILKHQDGFKKDYGQAAIGILIFEDIIAIIMLVILAGFGVTGQLAWGAVWQVSLLIGVFVVMVFFIGRMISPYILLLVDKTGNQEVLTLVTVGLVLGIGSLADWFHFSTELGAFLAGAILSQSRLSEAIEHAIEPLRNLFTAVFFVTIGMLIEPKLLTHYWKQILLLTILVVLVKVLTCWLGLYMTGIRSKTSFKAAVCKAQIGEFSFVIASLGQSLGVADSSLMALAVGVSLGTIVVVPIVSNRAGVIFDFLEERAPKTLKDVGTFYHLFLDSVKAQLSRNALLMLIKRPALQVIAYSLIFHGVILLGSLSSFQLVSLELFQEYTAWVQLGVWILTGLLCAPFLFAIIRNLNAFLLLLMEAVLPMHDARFFIKSSVRNIFNTSVLCIVVLLFSASYLSAIARYLPSGSALAIFLSLIVLAGFFFWSRIIHLNSRMEQLFIASFKQHTQSLEEEKRKQAIDSILKRYPWPISIQEIAITPATIPCGQTINVLNLRGKTGACVIALTRQGYTHYDPSPDAPLFPGDRLVVLGDTEQVQRAQSLVLTPLSDDEQRNRRRGFKIQQILLNKQSILVGETLMGAELRRRYSVNIIGIQRGEERITNPRPDEILQAQDILVVVANADALDHFLKIVEAKGHE